MLSSDKQHCRRSVRSGILIPLTGQCLSLEIDCMTGGILQSTGQVC